jgi:RimJ/RimL family protein N-acetyltransferase
MSDEQGTAVLDPPATSTTTEESQDLEIEAADWSDAPAVVEIIRSSAGWYEDIVDPEDLSEHYVDRDWARENFSKREFYVARIQDRIGGTISLQEVGDDHLYLGYVYLHTDFVGNGYGGELLDFARNELIRRGRNSMVLIAHPEAEWARKAYLRYGFEIVARDRDAVLSWQDGWLEPYYEEGFQLYEYRP